MSCLLQHPIFPSFSPSFTLFYCSYHLSFLFSQVFQITLFQKLLLPSVLLLFLSDLLLQHTTMSNIKMLVLVLTSMSCKHNHSKYRLCSGKLTALIRLATLIRFPEQTLEMDMEKGKRFSTWVASLEKQPICVFWLITVLGLSTDGAFTATLSIRKLASFCLSEKDYMFIMKTLLQNQGPDLLKWSSITLRPELIPKT